MMHFKINPGELAFMFGKCKRCYWNKVREGINPPSRPIPNVISAMDKIIKEKLSGKNLQILGEQFPDGTVIYVNQKAMSAPIKGSKGDTETIISGIFPLAYKLTNNTYGVALVKTSDVLQEYIPVYWLQLQAYVFALEHSTQEGFELEPVSQIGIISYTPQSLQGTEMQGKFEWLELEIDRQEFKEVLKEIIKLLKGKEPEPEPDCEWCNYIKTMSCRKQLMSA